ncbi:Coiled-coil domain-containing protein r3hcc1l, partial [Halocaridina rubra]
SPPSNSKDELLESGSSSPKDPLAKASPERMPVTVPSDQGSNRRRGKAAAQIYRPPPARSSQDTNFSPQSQQQLNHYQQHPYQPQQQQYQLHQPAYSQRYQPRPHNAKANHNVLQQQELQQYQPVSRQRTDSESSTATVSNEYHNNKVRGRRPDQVLYVPRGRRHLPNDPGSARGTPTPLADYESHQRPPSPAYSICSTASEFSGRNRYNKQGGSCLGSQISIYDGEIDKVHGKPPLSRDFSRESTPGNGRHKGNGGRFSTHTLSLIERCLNQDSEQRYNEYSNFETDSVHNSPSPKHSKVGGGSYRAQKSPTPTRDIHSIHSKENVIHPFEPGSRARKSRKNRKRHSRSRDHSSEHYNYAAKDSNSKGNVSHNGEWQNSPGERGFGSCERIFYNSNFNSSQDRYDRGYDNYDRYSSINSSRASSRNSSRERTPQRNINQNWRGGSNPPSPSKGPVIFYHSNHSSGKPPSGRLGSLPNVSFDSEETPGRRLSYHNEENNKYYTLPGKSNDPAFSNSHSQATVKNNIEYGSGCIVSDRIDTELSSSVTCTTIPDNDLTTQNQITDGYCLQNEDICNKDFHSSSSSHESEVVTDVTNQLQDYTVVKDGAVSMQECNSKEENGLMITPDNSENLFIDTENLPEPLDGSIKNVSIQDNQFLSADDASVNSADVSSEVTHEHDSYYDAVAEPAMSESLKESTDEIVSSDNDIKDNSHKDTKENITEVEEKVKKNPKKFLFDWADEVEDSWDSLYDDNGECLDPNIKRQLSNSLGKIKLEKPANDYYSFQPKEPEISEEEYGHVIEIYDFPVSFKTQDLMMVFSSFQNTGFDIKWVDDTHALGIFATALIAAEALSVDHPFLKTRSLSLATKSSKAKAMRITDALLPYKPRPATSASLARRLVSGALGLKVNISREVREAERQKLKDAKAQKRLAAKQRVDAWEGNLA